MIDLPRHGAGGARHKAADVGLVGEADPKADQHALMEGGRDGAEIRRMGRAGFIGIVANETVAGLEALRGVALQQRLHPLLIGGAMILQAPAQHDHASLGVREPRRPVLRLPQDRRIAAVVERIFHGGGGLAQAAGDDFRGDGIDGRHHLPSLISSVPVSCTSRIWPASRTVVESNWWISAGPAMTSPAARCWRS